MPDPPEGSVAAGTFGLTDRRGDTSNDGPLEKRPHGAGGQAQPPDFLGNPDARGPAAAKTSMTVTAEDPPGPDGPSGTAIIESDEHAVPDEHADRPAMRARRQFEPLGERGPLRAVPVKPPLVAHDPTPAGKSPSITRVGRAGKAAGSEKLSQTEEAGSPNRNGPQNRTGEVTELSVHKHSPDRIAIR